MRFARPLAVASLASLMGMGATAARADDNDLVLSRLQTTMGGTVVPSNEQFRSLTSELGVIIAPRFVTPSDTLGFSGFQFSADVGFTSIDAGAPYWCATEESSGCASGFTKSGMVQTVGFFARKGIWLPVPSFEIGAGAVHVGSSRMWAAQAYGKLALHEGFHDWPLPSVAIRGAASRLMGTEQLDLTVASLDISISKRLAVGGTWAFTPYAGWNVLWIVPRSQVIDATPNVAVKDNPSDVRNNFVFPDQDTIVRHRFFVGAKLKYYVFALTIEGSIALSGSSVDDRAGIDMPCSMAPAPQQAACDATDQAGSQTTLLISGGMDF